jgi:hypothetical protein
LKALAVRLVTQLSFLVIKGYGGGNNYEPKPQQRLHTIQQENPPKTSNNCEMVMEFESQLVYLSQKVFKDALAINTAIVHMLPQENASKVMGG